MKDSKGVDRGKCSKCSNCAEYQPPTPAPDSGTRRFKCSVCQCPPGVHNATTKASSSKDTMTTNGSSCSIPVSHHVSGMQLVDSLASNSPPVTVCAVPSCGKEVDFDIHTGLEYGYCTQHNDPSLASCAPMAASGMQVMDIEMDSGGFGGV